MRFRPALVFLLIVLAMTTMPTLADDPPALVQGTVLDGTGAPPQGAYALPSPDLERPALIVRGDGITVDFANVTLVGSDDPTRPDRFTGVGVRVEGKNITIKNLTARGYKVALFARGVDGLKLVDCDLSYNFRQRLLSDPWREDLADWMSYHQNEEDEWLRFGAAVYLRDCDGFEVRGLRVTGGQNGLMLTNCNDGLVHSSLISFNSSLGIGMYRSSRNKVVHNRLDFNVRGHSEGVYNRGQDSAAILVYEQSSENLFAYNSATHSGDGFFLWAGQSTLDTGEGGCNDNLVYANDFSYAPTNGIEATFSHNNFVGNKVHGCWHGVWGGYSYDSLFLANDFADNEDGVNIEHGQNNSISYNTFTGDATGIFLHARGTPPDWGYGKDRDTASAGYNVIRNEFRRVKTAIRARDTRDIKGFGNTFENVGERFDLGGAEFVETVPSQRADATREGRIAAFKPKDVPEGQAPPPLVGHPPKRDAIRVTAWGPYDYRRPALWPDVRADASGMTLRALGPAGEWRDFAVEGGSFAGGSSAGEAVTVRGDAGKLTDIVVRATWVGEKDGVDEFGRTIPAGTPVAVEYRRFVAPIDWRVRFFAYDEATEPRTKAAAFAELLKGKPLATAAITMLDYRGGRPWAEGAPADRFATAADGTLTAPAGEYVLHVTSDDGIRLWLDDKLLLDDWTYHAPKTVAIPVKLDGEHRLRVEHFEIDGHAALKVELRKP